MSAWGTRRQLSFVLVFILILFFVMVVLVALNRQVPTCADNVANQNELGVDCGGPCAKVCSVETNDILVLWSRIFRVREGVYDVAVYLENPNRFGVLDLDYMIRIYDTDNLPVKDVIGKTYLNPHEKALVFIPLINLGYRIPVRAFVTFPEEVMWKRLKNDPERPSLRIRDQRIEVKDSVFKLSADVINNSSFVTKDIELYAFLYDKNLNVVHVSRSTLDLLAPSDSSNVVFTWPELNPSLVKSADIFTRVNLVDGNILKLDEILQ